MTRRAAASSRKPPTPKFQPPTSKEGWTGWDVVKALMPESEIGDLIVEIRSATAGVGSFTFKFDHMAELSGKPADQIVAARRAAE